MALVALGVSSRITTFYGNVGTDPKDPFVPTRIYRLKHVGITKAEESY